jgi:serine/threonine-protein kinase
VKGGEGGKSRWASRLFLLLFFGAIGGALYFEPVRAMLRPAYDSAVVWVKREIDPPPPPAPDTQTWPPPQKAKPPNPLDQPPPNTAPTTTPEAEAKADPVTPEPSTPEPSTEDSPAAEPKGSGKGSTVAKAGQSPSKAGTSKTKGQPKATEPAAPAGTEAQPSKPGDLQAKLEKQPNTTVEENPTGEAVVVDTKDPRKMKKAGIGLLTLYTVPRAAVFDGNTSLGTTPLVKVPLQGGTYRLRIVDPEGNSRLFSAPVTIAKDNKYTITVSDLPPYGD